MDPLWPLSFNMWLNTFKGWQQINGNQTLTSLATLKCDKTIGGKVLIAAPAARPMGKLKLIQFLPALCPKAHPSQSPQMFSSAKN